MGSRFLNPSPALLGAGVTFCCSSVSLGQSIDHLSNEGPRSVQCRAIEGQWRQWDGDETKRVDGKLSSSVNFDDQQANPQPPHLLQKNTSGCPHPRSSLASSSPEGWRGCRAGGRGCLCSGSLSTQVSPLPGHHVMSGSGISWGVWRDFAGHHQPSRAITTSGSGAKPARFQFPPGAKLAGFKSAPSLGS